MSGIKEKFDHMEKIGVIGSPSSTAGLNIDILGTAVKKRLVGGLSVFHYTQDNEDHYAMGQITEVQMQNVWTQDPTMRGIIRQKGRVDPITERQDVHTAKMMVSSVFSDGSKGIEPSSLGTVPATGTSIRLLDQSIMESLFANYRDELFYLGNAYGTSIPMPMWFKHFGSSREGSGGVGEAYHIGVFGKTGSGKSVLAKMMMGYAKHPSMSIFVLDPQGEFASDLTDASPLRKVLVEKLGRNVEIYDLHNLVLTDKELFKRILANSGFFEELGIIMDANRYRAANEVLKALQPRRRAAKKGSLSSFGINAEPSSSSGSISLHQAHTREAFDRAWDALGREQVQNNIYTSKDTRERLSLNYETADPDEFYERWRKVANLFSYEHKVRGVNIRDLVKKIGERQGNTIIIDLSENNVPPDTYWNDSIRFILIGEFLKTIKNEAEEAYRSKRLLNCLVVIDEAHRLAPREDPETEDMKIVRNSLIDAIRTTRKYGLGWMFISQTLSSLHREIISQIRIYVFGFGLAWGTERFALRDIIGGADDALQLYQMFRDPQSSLGERTYPFMTIGPISPLSFSGTPLFFNALRYPDELLRMNFG
jgi:energy-coupling factor transporter ATP-binding protein EcfA2